MQAMQGQPAAQPAQPPQSGHTPLPTQREPEPEAVLQRWGRQAFKNCTFLPVLVAALPALQGSLILCCAGAPDLHCMVRRSRPLCSWRQWLPTATCSRTKCLRHRLQLHPADTPPLIPLLYLCILQTNIKEGGQRRLDRHGRATLLVPMLQASQRHQCRSCQPECEAQWGEPGWAGGRCPATSAGEAAP